METRPFGSTALSVSIVGLGTGSIGDPDVSDEQAEEVLSGALDAGVTLIDTARSYGLAEERIGKFLSHRRSEFVLSTKGGYGVAMVQDWTHAAVTRGVERALQTMKTDVIDVFFLHSCPKDVAVRDDILEALERAHDAGKLRAIGYSGEGEALGAATRSGRLGAIQCSVNLVDQKNIDAAIPSAESRGMAVIAKRPLANAVWSIDAWPDGEHVEYWQRLRAMQLTPPNGDWLDFAIRFSAFAPGVTSAIVGTRDIGHLADAIASVECGDIDATLRKRIETTFHSKGASWGGKV